MNAQTNHYLLFTTASKHDPRGDWRFVVQTSDGAVVLEAFDREPESQGERLELFAVVRGLESLDNPSKVTLVNPTSYVRRGLSYGLSEWRQTGWMWERYGQMVPVKNRDLWQRLDVALHFHQVECRRWRFDPPHAGHEPLGTWGRAALAAQGTCGAAAMEATVEQQCSGGHKFALGVECRSAEGACLDPPRAAPSVAPHCGVAPIPTALARSNSSPGELEPVAATWLPAAGLAGQCQGDYVDNDHDDTSPTRRVSCQSSSATNGARVSWWRSPQIVTGQRKRRVARRWAVATERWLRSATRRLQSSAASGVAGWGRANELSPSSRPIETEAGPAEGVYCWPTDRVCTSYQR